MVGNASVSYFWHQVCVTTFGIAVSMIPIQVGNAQIRPVAATEVPGTNTAQQMMGESISRFCPGVSALAAPTQNQVDLATMCSAIIGNAMQLQGESSTSSYGL